MQIEISLSAIQRQSHADALKKTGYWGKRAASVLMLAKDTGEVLTLKRSNKVLDKGTWAGVSGAIDRGEGPKRAILREIVEEIGYHGKTYLVPLPTFEDGSFKCYNFLGVVPEIFKPTLNYENTKGVWVRDIFALWQQEPLHKGIQWLIDNHLVDMYAAVDTILAARKDAVHNPMRHGHVRPSPDGMRARCGATRLCTQCKTEKKAIDLGLIK